MIWESGYWKADLLRHADSLHGRLKQRRWSGASFAGLEKTVMLGFYSIRKLAEAKKISDAIMTKLIPFEVFPCVKKPVTRMNWHRVHDLYDLEAGTTENHDLLFLCNQIIHSYVFDGFFSEDRQLERVLFVSDRKRNDCLYSIRVDQIIRLFTVVGTNYPTTGRWMFNERMQDYDMHSE